MLTGPSNTVWAGALTLLLVHQETGCPHSARQAARLLECIAESDGLDEAAVRARIAAQMTNAERMARADVVIDNSGTLEQFVAKLDAAWNELLERRKAKEVAR